MGGRISGSIPDALAGKIQSGQLLDGIFSLEDVKDDWFAGQLMRPTVLRPVHLRVDPFKQHMDAPGYPALRRREAGPQLRPGRGFGLVHRGNSPGEIGRRARNLAAPLQSGNTRHLRACADAGTISRITPHVRL
jgi:hypothetical protein